ncbi:Organic cation transporter protein [Mizuhopecten yessoensis]|uniref:Organic cation transporter protein n=1 Tax=Mizuhopecten yessoensis TaxID=6573 RepID=A0A210Q8C2_MIZYE|nr:Organic cation transporter protein [Mizuhopecten yessoensis]
MRFDDILKAIGEFGPYQRRIYFFICLPIIFIGISDINNALLLFPPKHRCNGNSVPGTITNYSDVGTEQTTNISDGYIQDTEADECFTRAVNSSDRGPVTRPCTSWTYDQSVFLETIVSKYDLVCESAAIPAYMQIFMYSGALAGSLCQGVFADRFGRQRVICCSLVLVFLSGFASAWAPNYYVFAILRFIQIMTSRGVYISSFILAIELVGPSKRQWAGFLFNYPYSAGIAMLAGIGYGLRHWKYIQIACSAPVLLFLIYWWIIPESPRWLISHGKVEQARTTILKMAASSKTVNCVPSHENMVEKIDRAVQEHSMMDYFKRRSLLCQSLVIFFNCFVVFHCFFGFTLNTGNLAGNFYLNVLLCGLADFPGYTIALFSAGRVGRKKLYISGMAVAGVSLLGSGVTSILATGDFKLVPIVLAMIGKTGMAVGFSVIYVWSAELFPTVVRNTGMGITLLTLSLPETQNANLPETVAHAKAMIRKKQYQPSSSKEIVAERIDISLVNS